MPASPAISIETAAAPDPAALYAARYACKRYDATRRLSSQTLSQLKQVLGLGISSMNTQPWHFYLLSGVQKDALAPCTHDYNQQKVRDASQLVVFCVKHYDEAHIAALNALGPKMQAYGDRLAVPLTRSDCQRWAEKQVYLNFGMFIAACAALGVDATPMEGFEPAQVDAALDLPARALRSQLLCPIGYRHPDDPNDPVRSPKVRFPLDTVLTQLG